MKTLDLREHLSSLVDEGRELHQSIDQHFSAKEIHKLRVCIRRIRTDMALLGSPLGKHEKKHLKKIWRKLGKVRDLDVAKDLADKFNLKPDDIIDERKHARKKLKHVLDDEDTEKLFDEIEKLSLRQESAKVDPVPHLNDLRCDLIKTPATRDNLHPLRIVMKKIRYAGEALGLGVAAFKEFQDVLGAFQDLEVFHQRHPHNLSVKREHKAHKDQALSLARPALTLGFKALAEMERRYAAKTARTQVS